MSDSAYIEAGWIQDFFEKQVLVLTTIAFLMLVLANQIALLPFLLFILFFGAGWLPPRIRPFQLSARQVNIFSWFYLPVFLLDIFFWSHSFIPATLHLILAMILLKIHQVKLDRDYFQIIILDFLLVLAASSLTINFSFLAGFLSFVMVCLVVLITFEIRRSSRDASRTASAAGASAPPLTLRPARGMPLSAQKAARRAIVRISGAALGAILVGGALFFFGLPRVGGGYFSRVHFRQSSLSGFTDRIQLGGIGKIQLDPSVMMRIQFSEGGRPAASLKWRGVTLDFFDGRGWSKRVQSRKFLSPGGSVYKIREP